MEAPLKRVLDELDISESSQKALQNATIVSVNDLLRKKRLLREEKLRGVSELTQERLYDFVCFLKWFKTKYKREPDLLDPLEFNASLFRAFTRNTDAVQQTLRLMDIEAIENTASLGEALFQMYTEGVQGFYDILESNEAYKAALVDYIAEEVQDDLAGDDLADENYRNGLITKCYFDIDKAVRMSISRLLCESGDVGEQPPPILIYGEMQSGKSAFKAVMIAVCCFMRIPVVVVTKGKGESDELFGKQVDYANGSFVEGQIFSPYGRAAEATVQDHFYEEQGGCIIVPDTESKLNMAQRLVSSYKKHRARQEREGKFAVIVDECDAMIRTVDRAQKMEQALERIQNQGPALQMLVTATPTPVMLVYKEEYKQNLEMFKLETSDDYVSVDMVLPLRDANGEPVHLLERLSHSSDENIEFDVEPPAASETRIDAYAAAASLFDDDEEEKNLSLSDKMYGQGATIPCTNQKVKMLYDAALATKADGAKGILVLDCTLSRVNVDGHKFEKAAMAQELYGQQGIDIAVIVFTGKGVSYRLPGQDVGYACARGRKIGDVIQKIDNHDAVGLETPIFVFGYSKMKRVISYRSDLRVPTHIVLSLGVAHSVENFVQALGRATFNGKSILERNGHSHVTLLTTIQDDGVAVAHKNFAEEINTRVSDGDLLMSEALSGANGKLPNSANYFRLTSRKTGQRPRRHDIGRHMSRDSFEEPPDELTSTEVTKKMKYWEDRFAQRILYILCKEKDNAMSTTDIKEAHNDRYREDSCNTTIPSKVMNKTLTAFKNDALVRKLDDAEQEGTWWEVDHPNRLRKLFINREYIRTDEQKRRRAEKEKRRRQTEQTLPPQAKKRRQEP